MLEYGPLPFHGITMKNPTDRDTRDELNNPEQLFASADKFSVVSHHEPVAEKRKLPSLADFRSTMPFQVIPSEVLVREDRDARD